MLHQVIAIFDIKVGAFAKPVAVPADGAGVRAFQDAVNDPNTEYHKHPEDYSVWNIGTYDDNTAIMESKKPIQLAQAIALKTIEA